MNRPSSLLALEARGESDIPSDLDRFKRVLSRLGDPQRGFPVIHVAGTNGKGSVAAMLESVLRHAGFKTGLYVSPHLSCVAERIRLNGRFIDEPDLSRLVAVLLEKEGATALSYFELLTAAAFMRFAERQVDVAVVEAGVGARNDSTNVFEAALASVVTSVDHDHAKKLGRGLAAIARQKAGVLKPGSPAFCPELPPEAMEALDKEARRLGAALRLVRDTWVCRRVEWMKNRQELRRPDGSTIMVSVLGERQSRNASLAASVLESLPEGFRRQITPEALRRGMADLAWPGRFQVVETMGKILVLDGAHNVEAARNLEATWRQSPCAGQEVLWFLGFNRGKDAAAVVSILAPLMRRATATQPPGARALAAGVTGGLLQRFAPRVPASVRPDFDEAFGRWLRSPGPPAAVVCGSFYLVSRALALIAGGLRRSSLPESLLVA